MRILREDLGSYNKVNYKGWQETTVFTAQSYKCHYCNKDISSSFGYWQNPEQGYIDICPECGRPTYFDEKMKQYPGVIFGEDVKYINDESVRLLYDEARKCMASESYTATVLCCRKLLMNIAVAKGEKEGLKFIEYITFLKDKGYIPIGGEKWVDSIRKKGNEATHEISIMDEEEAKLIIMFSSMLLKLIYEMPNSLTQLIKK